MTVPADIAAAQTAPDCGDVLDLMNRLETLHETDPYEARRLYFSWKALTRLYEENPHMLVGTGVPDKVKEREVSGV